jgi:hypothetical protein
LPTDLDCVGDGGRAGVVVPGEGASSSSPGDVGDSTKVASVIFATRDEPDRPLAIELASPRSDLELSIPLRAEADALGLSFPLSSPELLILLLIDERMDLDELSLVSDFEMEGYCCKVSGKLFEEPLFKGVRVPSLPFD